MDGRSDRERLLQAYRATSYLATDSTGTVAARIGEHSLALDALLERWGVQGGAFITAHNPRGEAHGAAANAAAAQALARSVASLGFQALPHRGVPDEPGWEPEEGLLVLGIDRAGAVGLAERVDQNALVYTVRGRAPELVLTRFFPS